MQTENKGVNPAEDRVQELQKMYTSFNEQQKFQERLNTEKFPHAIPENVCDVFFQSRRNATAATLGGSVENYLRLMRMEDLSEITYMDAAGILNFIESCSPVNSGVCSHGTFLDALEAAHKVATELWQPDTQLWREEIAEEKVKLKEFVQAEIAKVNASIKGKAKPKRDGKVVSMNQN